MRFNAPCIAHSIAKKTIPSVPSNATWTPAAMILLRPYEMISPEVFLVSSCRMVVSPNPWTLLRALAHHQGQTSHVSMHHDCDETVTIPSVSPSSQDKV